MDPPAPGLFIGSGHSAPRSPLVRNNEHNMGAIVAAPTPTLYLHNPGQSLPELSPRVNRAYYLYHSSRMSTAKQAEKKGASDDGRSRGTLSIDAEHQHPYISHDLPQYRGDDGGKGKQAARQQPNLDYEVEKANGSISEIGIGESALMRRKTARSEASRKRQEELKMNFDKFHGENGVRTVIGNIGPVQNGGLSSFSFSPLQLVAHAGPSPHVVEVRIPARLCITKICDKTWIYTKGCYSRAIWIRGTG